MMARPPSTTLPSTPLRTWREREGITWVELARRAGVSVETVKRAAAGKAIDDGSAAAIATVTGIAPELLRAGVDGPPRAPPSPTATSSPRTSSSRRRERGDAEPSHRVAKDPRTKAGVLLVAELCGDAIAAEDTGFSERSIRRWRAELEYDPELAKAYAGLLAAKWGQSLERVVAQAAARMGELIPQVGLEQLRDLLATLETGGGLLVQRQWVMRRSEGNSSGTGEPEAHRDDPSDGASREGARRGDPH